MRRVSTVHFRVTRGEYEHLEKAAVSAGKSLSEMARERVLCPASQTDSVTVLAEILGIRPVLTALFKAIAEGKPKSGSEIDDLVKKVDAEKLMRAQKKLEEWRRA